MNAINSYEELDNSLQQNPKLFVLIYKQGATQSDCAVNSLSKASETSGVSNVYSVDVSKVNDIHTRFGITTAPSLLLFENKQLKNVVKGCQDSKRYTSILSEMLPHEANSDKNKKAAKHVLVYTTPTCSWCNTLKSYLRTNRIAFNEIDVSSDQRMAEQMVRKSGQQGVPQIEINGRIIVGFDRPKIDQLLEIQ